MSAPQATEGRFGESPAHVVLGLVAVLAALVFGGMSYFHPVSAVGASSMSKLVRKAIPDDVQIASLRTPFIIAAPRELPKS